MTRTHPLQWVVFPRRTAGGNVGPSEVLMVMRASANSARGVLICINNGPYPN